MDGKRRPSGRRRGAVAKVADGRGRDRGSNRRRRRGSPQAASLKYGPSSKGIGYGAPGVPLQEEGGGGAEARQRERDVILPTGNNGAPSRRRRTWRRVALIVARRRGSESASIRRRGCSSAAIIDARSNRHALRGWLKTERPPRGGLSNVEMQ